MLRHWLTCFALLAAMQQPVVAEANPDRPVVVIPGILGSKICEKASGKVIWGDRWSLGNFQELALPSKFDDSKLLHRPCGLIDSVNVLGPWQIHQYDDLTATLLALGYRENVDLFFFDYDWRLSSRTTARRFQEFISNRIPSGQFDLLAHSMGGIVAKVWMAEHGGAPRVKTFVTFGTPHLGSATTFKTLDEGWGFWGNLAAHGLSQIRETSMTFPSIYELLPAYPKCCAFRSNVSPELSYFDPFLTKSWGRFSLLPVTFSKPQRKSWLDDTLHSAKAVLDLPIPPGPKVIMVVNSLIPTAWRVVFDPTNGKILHYISQPGDGTVAQWSAANNQLGDARPSLTSHQTIFADDAARQVVKWALAGGAQPVSGVTVDIKASLRTKTNKFVDIRTALVQIDPPVLEPCQAGHVILEVGGLQDLAEADVSNIEARLDAAPGVLLLQSSHEVEPDIAGKTLMRLSFPFVAPCDLGSFSATVTLPAVANISDTGLVVPK